MKQKITEVQQYFLTKLVEADFEITNGDQYSLSVLVDNQYKFNLWIANGVDSLNPYAGAGNYFMELPELNSRQQKTLSNKLEAEIVKYTGIQYQRELYLREIAELQEKLQNLES